MQINVWQTRSRDCCHQQNRSPRRTPANIGRIFTHSVGAHLLRVARIVSPSSSSWRSNTASTDRHFAWLRDLLEEQRRRRSADSVPHDMSTCRCLCVCVCVWVLGGFCEFYGRQLCVRWWCVCDTRTVRVGTLALSKPVICIVMKLLWEKNAGGWLGFFG